VEVLEVAGNKAATGAVHCKKIEIRGVTELGEAALCSKGPHHHPASRYQQLGEPTEKMFYKTRLCKKFDSISRCAYEDGCTFAHRHAELRPPLSPLLAGARRSRLAPVPPPTESGGQCRRSCSAVKGSRQKGKHPFG
jgi:hypothetical protein